MTKLLASTALALALALSIGAANATTVSNTPISAPDPGAGTTDSITAAGTTETFVFTYKSADDVDVFLNGTTELFRNTDPLGTTATISGLTIGQILDLTFKNNTTGESFQAGVAGPDGEQHVAVQHAYTDFQTDPPRFYLTSGDISAALGVMNGIDPNQADWGFIGMEDLLTNQASDFDYNDLVIGYTPVVAANEASSMAMLGFGLIGFVGVRNLINRKRNQS